MNDTVYTMKQASVYTGVTERELRLAVREGKLKAWIVPHQRTLLVRKTDLDAWKQQP